jgi:ubiquinol oxidase
MLRRSILNSKFTIFSEAIADSDPSRLDGKPLRQPVSSGDTVRHCRFTMPLEKTLQRHRPPACFRDRAALAIVKFLRFFADAFFARRYGHRAVVLETVAAVPGMVGGTLQHLRALRRMESDHGWIRQLLDEAENERMHLMTFIEIARPSHLERFLIVLVQGVFYNFFFLLYLVSPETAHRIVGYLEEEAVYSYTEYLAGVDDGTYDNAPAPKVALDYWKLPADARLRDVILVVRADEAGHRDLNHRFADELATRHT